MTTLHPPRKKTRPMLAAEALAGKPLEEALPELVNTRGLRATAELLDHSTAGIYYWLMWFGIKHKFVCIPPGYRLLLIPEDWNLPQIDLTEE